MKINIGTFRDEKIFFHPFSGNNGHIISIGGSGSGKTTLSINIANQIIQNGGTVIAFDSHNVLRSDEIHTALRADFDSFLNDIDVYRDGFGVELTPHKFPDGTEESAEDIVECFVSTLAKTLKLGVQQKSILKKAMMLAYDTGSYHDEGIKVVGEMLEDVGLRKATEVAERLSAVTTHNVFVDKPANIVHGSFNVIRLSQFPFDVQCLLEEIILSFLFRWASTGIFKHKSVFVFVDECHNLNMGSTGILPQILREGRKYGINLILTTQTLSNTKAGLASLMMQSGLTVFFQTAKNETASVASLIDPASVEDWAFELRHLKRGQFVAAGPLSIGEDERILKKPIRVDGRLLSMSEK